MNGGWVTGDPHSFVMKGWQLTSKHTCDNLCFQTSLSFCCFLFLFSAHHHVTFVYKLGCMADLYCGFKNKKAPSSLYSQWFMFHTQAYFTRDMQPFFLQISQEVSLCWCTGQSPQTGGGFLNQNQSSDVDMYYLFLLSYKAMLRITNIWNIYFLYHI